MNTFTVVRQWLLEGPAWVQYQALASFPDHPFAETTLNSARQALIEDPGVQAVIAELRTSPTPVLTNHKAAGHPLHKMAFLADLGFIAADPGIGEIANRLMEGASPEGPFQVMSNIPKAFGGNGQDQLSWMLCDAPLTLYVLVKFGLSNVPSVQKAVAYLASLVRDNGWPCAASPVVGKFRGPGRKEDPCPYANLLMLKVLAQIPEYQNSPAARSGVESALSLWAARRESHPYLFKMGTDFCKLKAPLVWYDILHVLDVLTAYPWALTDPRLKEMLLILQEKMDGQGRFTPESVWLTWKDWEFGQKKAPSRWLTLIAWRALYRAGVA